MHSLIKFEGHKLMSHPRNRSLAHSRTAARYRFAMFLGLVLPLLRAPASAAPEPSEATARLDCGSIPSAILGRSVDYCVALPPGYDSSTSARFPTLYFLHGLFENERRWSERGGQSTWEDLMSQGKLGKFLVVLPNGGRTFYVNSLDGRERYEDFIIQELVPGI